ncbi:uncharacterized protein LOC106011702, partial [Aplysia californica]|uniref:Uncharacterized protein LOC106011702 n=1 Tax=Aplysia californica TaxID=6500 RepID=A0ABM0ZZE9_APLCA
MCVSDECRVRQCASNPCSAPSECTVLTRVCRSGKWGEGDNSGGSECLASASERLNQMASDTDDFQHLTAGQVAEFTTKLKGLQSAVATDDELAKVALKVVSNLASVNVSVSEMVEKQNGSNAQLRDFVETYSADVKLNNGKVSVTSGDIEVKAVSLGDSLTRDNNIFNVDGDSDV